MINGYTYSYVHKEPRNGTECCRPIKSKCNSDESCKISRGRVQCGNGCARIIEAIKKLQAREKKKNKREKTKEDNHRDYEEESFEEYSSESFEEYSYEDKKEDKKEEVKVEGGFGLKVKEGQKLSQKQMQMLESAAEERKTSTNPLCQEKQQNQLFRCLKMIM